MSNTQDGLLDELDAAVAGVVEIFKGMRSAASKQLEWSSSSVLHAHMAEMRQAVARLQGLLSGVAQQPLQQQDGNAAADQGTAADPASRQCVPCPSSSRLLKLPNELLARVAREAGKVARLVCQQLREAYGCPGSALQQPLCGYEADHVEARQLIQYQQAGEHQSRLREAVLDACLKAPAFPMGFIQQCQQRWPGQVTRLELSTAHTIKQPDMEHILARLPGLQELKCPHWSDDTMGAVLTALTALSLYCTAKDAINNCLWEAQRLPDLHRLAPSLRSLHLDLRYRCLDAGLRLVPTMQALSGHLSHLSLRLDESVDVVDSPEQQCALDALSALSGTLHSLELLSPATWLGPGLLPVLQSMRRLTSLVWSFQGQDEVPDAVLPKWHEVGRLQRLVVGPPGADWNPKIFDYDLSVLSLCNTFVGGAMLQLASLAMPPIVLWKDDDGDGPDDLWTVKALLRTVQQNCPQITHLQVGCAIWYGDDEYGHGDWHLLPDEQPAHQQWLQPVGGMLQLRRLVLCIDAADMRQLKWLAPLPVLTSLSLHLVAEVPQGFLAWRNGRDVAIAAAATLRQLERLEHLSIEVLDGHLGSQEPLAALLRAAGSLPQLQALELPALPLQPGLSQHDHAALCSVLIASPLPRLRQLTLFHHPWRMQLDDNQLSHQAAVWALLCDGMPARVRLSHTYCGWERH